jgi:Ca2+-binding EF-hand superfamily protein
MNKLSITALVFGSGLALAGAALAGPDCDTGKAKAGRMSQLDANKDGKVTLAELKASKQSWLREVDANKDGVATRLELEARFAAGHAERMQKLFESRDTNKDGRLTREESHMPERWFSRSDANSDGILTREELSQRPTRPGSPAGHRGGKLAHLDTNSDDKIDAAELETAAARMLARLDQNKDGVLSADELGRNKGRHRGRGGQGGHGGAPGDAPHPSNAPAQGNPAGTVAS